MTIRKIRKRVNGVEITLLQKLESQSFTPTQLDLSENDQVALKTYIDQQLSLFTGQTGQTRQFTDLNIQAITAITQLSTGITVNRLGVIAVSDVRPEDGDYLAYDGALNRALWRQFPNWSDRLDDHDTRIEVLEDWRDDASFSIETIENTINSYNTLFDTEYIKSKTIQLPFAIHGRDLGGLFFQDLPDPATEHFSIKVGANGGVNDGYSYGDVTDLSMRFSMDATPNRGWTWSRKAGTYRPAASLSIQGQLALRSGITFQLYDGPSTNPLLTLSGGITDNASYDGFPVVYNSTLSGLGIETNLAASEVSTPLLILSGNPFTVPDPRISVYNSDGTAGGYMIWDEDRMPTYGAFVFSQAVVSQYELCATTQIYSGSTDVAELIAAAAGGAVALDALTDVTAPSPSEGDVLYYNGAAWINNPGLTQYSDVDLDNITATSIFSTGATNNVISVGAFTASPGGAYSLNVANGSAGALNANGKISTDQGLLSDQDIFINYNGGRAGNKAYLWFYESGISGKSLSWDTSEARFEFDDTLYVGGTLISAGAITGVPGGAYSLTVDGGSAGAINAHGKISADQPVLADSDMFINYNNGRGGTKSYLWFYEGGVSGKSLAWDSGNGWFEFDDQVYVDGTLVSIGAFTAVPGGAYSLNIPSGSIGSLNANGKIFTDQGLFSDQDIFINYNNGRVGNESHLWFYEGGISGKSLAWNTSEQRFNFDDSVAVSGVSSAHSFTDTRIPLYSDGAVSTGDTIQSVTPWVFSADTVGEWPAQSLKDFAFYYDEYKNRYHIVSINKNTANDHITSTTKFIWAATPNLSASSFYAVSGGSDQNGYITSLTGTIGGRSSQYVWAPQILKNDNRYYMFYTGVEDPNATTNGTSAQRQRIFCAVSEDVDNWDNASIGATSIDRHFILDGGVDIPWTTWGSVDSTWTGDCRDAYVVWDDVNEFWAMFVAIRLYSGATETPAFPNVNPMAIGLASSYTLTSGWDLVGWVRATASGDTGGEANWGGVAESPSVFKGPDNLWYLQWTWGTAYGTDIRFATSSTLFDTDGYTRITDLDNNSNGRTGIAAEIIEHPLSGGNSWIMSRIWGNFDIRFDELIIFTGGSNDIMITSHTAFDQAVTTSYTSTDLWYAHSRHSANTDIHYYQHEIDFRLLNNTGHNHDYSAAIFDNITATTVTVTGSPFIVEGALTGTPGGAYSLNVSDGSAGGINSIGKISTNQGLLSDQDVFINYNNGRVGDKAYLWFYEGGISGQSLSWDTNISRFVFDAGVNVDGVLSGSTNAIFSGYVIADYGSADGQIELDMTKRGCAMNMENEPGGWARGLTFYNGSTLLGGVQGYGPDGTSLTRIVIGPEFDVDSGVTVNMPDGFVGISNRTPNVELSVSGDAHFSGGNLIIYSGSPGNAILSVAGGSLPGNRLEVASGSNASINAIGNITADGGIYAGLRGLYTNYGGPNDDAYVYFFQGGAQGRFLRWETTPSKFGLNDDITVTGTVKSKNIKTKSISVPDTRASEDIPMFYVEEDMYFINARSVVKGTSPSVTFQITSGSSIASVTTMLNATTTSSTNGETDSMSGEYVPAGNWVVFQTSATGGTSVDLFHVTLSYSGVNY